MIDELRAVVASVALACGACCFACAPEIGAPLPAPPAAPDDDDTGPLWEGTVRRERSLAWSDAALLDDPQTVGLARVMDAAAERLGANPGALFDRMLRRFATTAHSERAGPARLAEQLADELGADPSTWDLDDAPFKVTGVHNRFDLAKDGHCGQLRVSLASTDEIIRPFHLLFLFEQSAPDSGACEERALAWASLSDDVVDDDEFRSRARAMLDDGLVADKFLLAESVELTVSPWEWRQWTPSSERPGELDNPPLFQQVDIERVNAPGALRDDFLGFVDDNEAALTARTIEIPERFRAPSVRVVQGAPWAPLDIGERSPELRKNIEIVGCAACHTADADFVQTRDDRTFSEFYTKELAARGTLLDDILHRRTRTVPFGPLQSEPVLAP